MNRIPPLMRVMPSFTDLAFLLPAGTLFFGLRGATTLLGDGDTGWHLRTGEWILDNGRVPTVDLFSYTRAGQPWFAWEWLWDVLFGWMHRHFGMESVILASLLVLCLTSALLYRLALRQSGHAPVAAAFTFVAMCASSIHWLARPHLFTLLLTVVFLSVLTRVEAEGRVRLLWLLPPLMVLWTNLHGGFFVGIALVGNWALGEWVSAALAGDREERRQALRRSVPYLLCAAGCLAVSFVNPYGYRLHQHVIEYLSDPYHREHISEFLSASFQPPSARFFEVLLVLGVLAAAGCVRRRQFAPAILLVLWAHLALLAARNIPLYALMAAPVAAEYVARLLRSAEAGLVVGRLREFFAEFREFAAEIGKFEAIGRVPVASAAAFSLVAALVFAPGASGAWKAEYDRARYPEAALQALGAEAVRSRIFTDDEWGDYLIYRLYPSGRVFVDGRSDFYGAAYGKAYLAVLEVEPQWKQTFSEFGVDMVLLPCRSALSGALKESAAWRVVYDDGVAIVFRPATHQVPDRTGFAGVRAKLPAVIRAAKPQLP